MKVIIAGSRDIKGPTWWVIKAIEASGFDIKEVVSGTARGIDTHGELWAKQHNKRITRFPADWDTYGKSAGYKRNEEMADYADALIAVWDGVSKGTKHMIDIATKKGLKVFVYEPTT